MTWAKLSDDKLDGLQAAKAGPLAMYVHMRATSWCCKHLTDGEVPLSQVDAFIAGRTLYEADEKGRPRQVNAAQLRDRLVEVGLWEVVGGSVKLVDFFPDQRAAAQVLAERDARKRAGKVGADRRWLNSGMAKPMARAMATAMAAAQQLLSSPASECQMHPHPYPYQHPCTRNVSKVHHRCLGPS